MPKKPKRQQTIDPTVASIITAQKEKEAQRRGEFLDPKAGWKQTNVRMDPATKDRARALATEMGVPFEEIVHIALVHLLDGLEAGQVELETRPAVVRNTLL